MFQILTSTRFHGAKEIVLSGLKKASASAWHVLLDAVSHCLPYVLQFLKLTFISGPKVLFTSRISGKCAAIMTMMCIPSLLFCGILTIPAFLFQSPQQQAYFYFASIINQDPSRWAVLVLTALCAVMSLAIPAAMPRRHSSVSY